mmetsp:Transcript_23071/g.66600  ORF Transcript_23071/g.66600 Transcript_23071/m.66600 type:complete len:227 (-) Transcript_23071:82-762(-)
MEVSTKSTAAKASAGTAASNLDSKMLARQVKSLKAENERLKEEVSELRKRAAATPPAAASAPKRAKTAAQKKKLFEKWAKALARESKKHKIHNYQKGFSYSYGNNRYEVTVKDTGVWSPEEFSAIFGGHGTKLQPTPDNKPTSVITILNFGNAGSVQTFFKEAGGVTLLDTGYEVQLWRQRSFQKSYKDRDEDSVLVGMKAHYNKSKQTLQLVFALELDSVDYADY